MYYRQEKHERIEHRVGEVVIGRIGNYLEDRNADGKPRPMIVLAEGDCQHQVAGLTTQAIAKMSGAQRPAVPCPQACGLKGPGYLFSWKPARVSRIDVRRHLGWVDHALVDMIERNMHVPAAVITNLRRAADEHHPGGGGPKAPGPRNGPRPGSDRW